MCGGGGGGGGGVGGGVFKGTGSVCSRHTFIQGGEQDAPALRTGDGGLKIFDDRSTLPTHPVPKLSRICTDSLGSLDILQN